MREMKDSGIEWIGEIPKDWKCCKVKYSTSFVGSGTTPTSSNQDFYDGDINWIQSGDLYKTVVVDTVEKKLTEKALKSFSALHIYQAPFIIMAMYGASVGNTAFSKIDACCNQACCCIKNNESFNLKFMFYWLDFAQIDFLGRAIGGTQPNISQDKIKNQYIVKPSLEEQQQIADYLDTQCSEIDATAEDIQKEISLLEDYKKSVITEAVTKGLNPDAEMKDSGIEWIGEVPKHWGTIRIGNAFSIRNERNYLPMEQVQLLSLYSGKGVFPTGEEGTTNRGNHAQTVADYKIVKKNDIVVNIILAWMGSLGISNYNGVVSPAYDVYIPNEEKVVPHYYHYVFRTSGIANECYRYGRGIMMMRWRTYSSEFKRIHVPFPPLEEQQQIADFLDSKCSEIDAIIADKKRQRGILAEYKKSLIYEYVTGKKEVPVHE